MVAALDLAGRRFVRLEALSPVSGVKRSTWLCRCDCGSLVEVRTGNLQSGNSKSCGCLIPDVAKGWAGTPEYTAFRNAKNRCERPQDVRFCLYGGRGIEFRFADMADFIACVGPRPSPIHSLDRINPDGHYEAGNVRWATAKVQARNKRGSLIVEIGCQSKPLSDWCEEFGQPYRRVWERIRSGWDAHRALTEPVGPTGQVYDARVRKVWGLVDQTVIHVEGAV